MNKFTFKADSPTSIYYIGETLLHSEFGHHLDHDGLDVTLETNASLDELKAMFSYGCTFGKITPGSLEEEVTPLNTVRQTLVVDVVNPGLDFKRYARFNLDTEKMEYSDRSDFRTINKFYFNREVAVTKWTRSFSDYLTGVTDDGQCIIETTASLEFLQEKWPDAMFSTEPKPDSIAVQIYKQKQDEYEAKHAPEPEKPEQTYNFRY